MKYIFDEKIKSISIFICIALLFSLESLLVQNLAFMNNPTFKLFLHNFIAACAILTLPVFAIRTFAIIQYVLSIGITSYVSALGSPPSFAAIYNGTKLLHDTGLSYFYYIPIWVIIVFTFTLCVKLFAVKYLQIHSKKTRVILSFIFLLLFSVIAGPRIVKTPVTIENKPGRFGNNTTRAIKRNGYVATWIKELIIGKYTLQAEIFVPKRCDSTVTENLPTFIPGRSITIIQVESLDYTVIGAMHKGLLVAPTLTQLANDGLLLQMDGTKRLGSANSDFELFNAQEAAVDVVYYAFLPAYPDSIIHPLRTLDYDTTAFHGLSKSYMDLGTAYPKMGFNKLFFSDEFVEHGYKKNDTMFMKQIHDSDLLDFASTKITNDEQFLHFIITITMHGGSKEKLTTLFADNEYYDTVNFFDQALSRYINKLEDGSMVIIYGDHQSYSGPKKNGRVPFMIYITGEKHTFEPINTIFTRCELSHYLRRMFSQADPTGMCKIQN